jgi:hypothetical protein
MPTDVEASGSDPLADTGADTGASGDAPVTTDYSLPSSSQPLPGIGQGAGYTVEELSSDFFGAIQIVDAWWAQHWSENFTSAYTSPQLLDLGPGYWAGVYNATLNRDGTTSGDLVPCGVYFLQDMNAHYCGPPVDADADFLAFDADELVKAAELGDAFVYFLVAHEWGHAIAARLDQQYVPLYYELQADCFAGAALQGALTDGTLTFDDDDPVEIRNALISLADATPWTKVGDHGSPEQRLRYYNTGVYYGAENCLYA